MENVIRSAASPRAQHTHRQHSAPSSYFSLVDHVIVASRRIGEKDPAPEDGPQATIQYCFPPPPPPLTQNLAPPPSTSSGNNGSSEPSRPELMTVDQLVELLGGEDEHLESYLFPESLRLADCQGATVSGVWSLRLQGRSYASAADEPLSPAAAPVAISLGPTGNTGGVPHYLFVARVSRPRTLAKYVKSRRTALDSTRSTNAPSWPAPPPFESPMTTLHSETEGGICFNDPMSAIIPPPSRPRSFRRDSHSHGRRGSHSHHNAANEDEGKAIPTCAAGDDVVVLAIVTRYPYFQFFTGYVQFAANFGQLQALEEMTMRFPTAVALDKRFPLNAEVTLRCVTRFCLLTTASSRRPDPSLFINIDAPLATLGFSFSYDAMLLLLSVMLSEGRILFVGHSFAQAADCCHAMFSFLYPFQWNTFVMGPIYPVVAEYQLLSVICNSLRVNKSFLGGTTKSALPQLLLNCPEQLWIADATNGKVALAAPDEQPKVRLLPPSIKLKDMVKKCILKEERLNWLQRCDALVSNAKLHNLQASHLRSLSNHSMGISEGESPYQTVNVLPSPLSAPVQRDLLTAFLDYIVMNLVGSYRKGLWRDQHTGQVGLAVDSFVAQEVRQVLPKTYMFKEWQEQILALESVGVNNVELAYYELFYQRCVYRKPDHFQELKQTAGQSTMGKAGKKKKFVSMMCKAKDRVRSQFANSAVMAPTSGYTQSGTATLSPAAPSHLPEFGHWLTAEDNTRGATPTTTPKSASLEPGRDYPTLEDGMQLEAGGSGGRSLVSATDIVVRRLTFDIIPHFDRYHGLLRPAKQGAASASNSRQASPPGGVATNSGSGGGVSGAPKSSSMPLSDAQTADMVASSGVTNVATAASVSTRTVRRSQESQEPANKASASGAGTTTAQHFGRRPGGATAIDALFGEVTLSAPTSQTASPTRPNPVGPSFAPQTSRVHPESEEAVAARLRTCGSISFEPRGISGRQPPQTQVLQQSHLPQHEDPLAMSGAGAAPTTLSQRLSVQQLDQRQFEASTEGGHPSSVLLSPGTGTALSTAGSASPALSPSHSRGASRRLSSLADSTTELSASQKFSSSPQRFLVSPSASPQYPKTPSPNPNVNPSPQTPESASKSNAEKQAERRAVLSLDDILANANPTVQRSPHPAPSAKSPSPSQPAAHERTASSPISSSSSGKLPAPTGAVSSGGGGAKTTSTSSGPGGSLYDASYTQFSLPPPEHTREVSGEMNVSLGGSASLASSSVHAPPLSSEIPVILTPQVGEGTTARGPKKQGEQRSSSLWAPQPATSHEIPSATMEAVLPLGDNRQPPSSSIATTTTNLSRTQPGSTQQQQQPQFQQPQWDIDDFFR